MSRNITKKIVAIITSLLIITLNASIGFGAGAFTDVKGHWAETYITELSNKGLIAGMEDSQFHPDDWITMEQFVKIIVTEKFGEQTPVSGGNWDSVYLKIAFDKGIIDDLDSLVSKFTRGDAAKIVDLSLQNLFDENVLEDNSVVEQLVDLPGCHTCRIHISEVYAKGIMTGRPGFMFDSEAALTRAEASAIIMKMLNTSLRMPPEKVVDYENNLLSPDILKILMDSDKDVILVDVRTIEEHNSGYIPGSILIPIAELKDQAVKQQLPDRNALIIVYCQSGGRSSQAYEFLIDLGYNNVHDFGGITRWTYELDKK